MVVPYLSPPPSLPVSLFLCSSSLCQFLSHFLSLLFLCLHVCQFFLLRSPGVALPFRDLRQPTRNITYFASEIRKMRSLQHTRSIKLADENGKTKVYPCTKKWKRSVNMPFIKSVNRSEHSTRHDEQTMSANPVLVYRRIW